MLLLTRRDKQHGVMLVWSPRLNAERICAKKKDNASAFRIRILHDKRVTGLFSSMKERKLRILYSSRLSVKSRREDLMEMYKIIAMLGWQCWLSEID